MHKSRETGTGSFGTRHCQAQFVPAGGRCPARRPAIGLVRYLAELIEVSDSTELGLEDRCAQWPTPTTPYTGALLSLYRIGVSEVEAHARTGRYELATITRRRPAADPCRRPFDEAAARELPRRITLIHQRFS